MIFIGLRAIRSKRLGANGEIVEILSIKNSIFGATKPSEKFVYVDSKDDIPAEID